MEPVLFDVEVLADEGLRDFCSSTGAEDFERSATLLSSTFLPVNNLAFVSLCRNRFLAAWCGDSLTRIVSVTHSV